MAVQMYYLEASQGGGNNLDFSNKGFLPLYHATSPQIIDVLE
jgi:hypothetical protein